MNIAFYTEAGTKRGMGHLVRCHTISKEFEKNNHKVDFYLDSDINFDCKFEELNYFKWESLDTKQRYDVIVIDSYIASLNIYNYLSGLCKLLVCIDDYGRLEYPKGLIINFAPKSKELFFQNEKAGYVYLLGLDYVPIQQKILDTVPNKKEQIFVMLGGMDIENLSVDVIDSIEQIDMRKVIVINDEQMALKVKNKPNVKVLYKPTDDELIENMANSVVAISTASMSLYELSYLNIPTIVMAINKNQEIGIKQSIKYNIATSQLNINDKDWKNILFHQIKSIDKSSNLYPIIDGHGVQRIYATVKKLVNL